MKRAPSPYVCSVCGLPLTRWRDGWKHAGNAYRTSCGKPAAPQLRSAYEAEMQAAGRLRDREESMNRYNGSNMSPFIASAYKICRDCETRVPTGQTTEVHPVPGLTMYLCAICTARAKKQEPGEKQKPPTTHLTGRKA